VVPMMLPQPPSGTLDYPIADVLVAAGPRRRIVVVEVVNSDLVDVK